MYQYRATVLRIVDGDTLHLDVDLGFDVRRKDSFRLAGLNAPEMSTAEGEAARDWLVDQLHGHDTITITTHKDKREKYGRYLATLWLNNESVNVAMIEAGHAVAYSGGQR